MESYGEDAIGDYRGGERKKNLITNGKLCP
jgi:hypothetical protein